MKSIDVKRTFLYLSKAIGLFRLSRRLTRRGLRILCYHGFAEGAESLFRPRLFMTRATFNKRLEFLHTNRYPVLALAEALARLDRGDMPDCATVITIDDGFYGVEKIASELLNKFSFPTTLYVTTYYCLKETPVFRLAVQYMFWATKKEFLDLSHLNFSLHGRVSLADSGEKEAVTWRIIEFGEEQCDEQRRLALARGLGQLLDIDFEELYRNRRLSLLTRDEIRSLALRGMNIQLHTHRHRLPLDEAEATREIVDNKSFLAPLVKQRLEHFCYPSGEWSPQFWPWLTAVAIKSAVTCEPGLNHPETPKLSLNRFLDAENISEIEFEAELTGYSELLRRARSRLKSVFNVRKEGKDNESTRHAPPLPAV